MTQKHFLVISHHYIFLLFGPHPILISINFKFFNFFIGVGGKIVIKCFWFLKMHKHLQISFFHLINRKMLNLGSFGNFQQKISFVILLIIKTFITTEFVSLRRFFQIPIWLLRQLLNAFPLYFQFSWGNYMCASRYY